ncbi:MAG: NAD(P)H-dependent oxidoreductase subunit E [Ignavibacteriales bacterium]|nr:NAD(P)H-dependent oxidoreductase subunit E [Ignavibacteriales bacterium]
MVFTEKNLQRIEDLKKRYPTTQALTLPVLWIAQEQFGFISEETMKYVARLLDVSFGHILGVVTFYTMFNQKPTGKHHVEVCTNVSCMLRGSGKIVEHLERRLGVKMGGTSSDRKWTLTEVECMGSCGTAPMLAIGEEYYENLTTAKLDHIIEDLK